MLLCCGCGGISPIQSHEFRKAEVVLSHVLCRLNAHIAEVERLGMGMELEFEGTHGEKVRPCSSILENLVNGEKNERAELNRGMLRDYFRYFKEAGFYGRVPIAIYTGTDAMHELASSTEPEDVEMYDEFCRFITDSPLRQK